MKYVIANWKAHKTHSEAEEWLRIFTSYNLEQFEDSLVVCLCVPDHLLQTLNLAFTPYTNFTVGVQDVSAFEPGPYTGEVPAQLLTGFATHALIGHSERRNLLHETNDLLSDKVHQCASANIEPIYCIRSLADPVPPLAKWVAYEPVEAIGSGKNAPLDEVIALRHGLPTHPEIYIYGGSVTSQNVGEYLGHPEIDGVLPGKASLDANEFYALLQAALKATK